MRIDVFTLVPHAFAWLTEQQPIAGVLGTELELRLINYRESTPLRAGQVDDEPYGGGAGMVLRVDVVTAMPRSLPAFTCGSAAIMLIIIICTWPPTRSVIAWPVPL